MKKELKQPVGTLFPMKYNVKGAVLMSVDDLHRAIVEGRWADTVRQVRSLHDEGRDTAASKLKGSLPLYCVAGDCRRGRVPRHLVSFTGYAPYDYDLKDPAEAARVVQACREIPWVKEAHVSVLHGVHLFVALGCVHPDVYPVAYEHVATTSRSMLTLCIANMKHSGIIINSTENTT